MNNQPSIVDKLREGAKRGDRSRGDVHAEEEGRQDNGGHYNNGCEMIV